MVSGIQNSRFVRINGTNQKKEGERGSLQEGADLALKRLDFSCSPYWTEDSEKKFSSELAPVAGLFVTRLGFEKIFKTQWVFKTRRSALLANTCSKYRNNFKLTCPLTGKLFKTSSVRWNLLGWQIWTALFKKEPWKVKPPLKAPKKSRDFWRFLGFFEPNRVKPLLPRILELLQHY